MKCSQARNRILAVSQPRKAPKDAREHVRGCASCQEWVKAAMQLDDVLHLLPVPAPPRNRKAALLAEFQAVAVETLPDMGVTTHQPTEPIEVSPIRPARKERFWSRFGVGVALAAGLAGIVVWWGNRPPTSRPDPILAAKPVDQLLASLMDRHISLAAKASNPIDRLDSLNRLAADLRTESVELALIATPDDMDALARMYSKVIEKGVLPQANQVRGPQQRTILENVRKQLEEAGEAIAKKAETTTRGSMEPLRLIAEASRKGDQHIRMLLKEDAS